MALDFLGVAAISIGIIFLSVLHDNNKNYRVIDNVCKDHQIYLIVSL